MASWQLTFGILVLSSSLQTRLSSAFPHFYGAELSRCERSMVPNTPNLPIFQIIPATLVTRDAGLISGAFIPVQPLSRATMLQQDAAIQQLLGVPMQPLNISNQPLNTSTPSATDPKRETRQQQSAVVQQITINQNSAQIQQTPAFGGGGFGRGGFGRGGFGRGGFGRGGFGRGGFGHGGDFFGRSYESDDETVEFQEEYSVPSEAQIPAAECQTNYVFSCQPQLTPVDCASCAGGGHGEGYGGGY